LDALSKKKVCHVGIAAAEEKCECCTQQQILTHSVQVDVFSPARNYGFILQAIDAPKRNQRRREV